MTNGKTIALTGQTFVGKVMSLLFNMLSRLVITFLPRSKRLLVSWLQSPSAVILEPRKIKSATVYTVSPSISHEVMGPDAMILVFWMLSLLFQVSFLCSHFLPLLTLAFLCLVISVCAHACSVLSDSATPWTVALLLHPWDCSCSVHGILQARIWEWAAISSSKGSSWPRDQTQISWVSCIGRQIHYHSDTWETLISV